MNNTTYTLQQLQSLTWQQIVKLGKATIIAILDELSICYDESDRYLCVCSTLYQHLKQQAIEVERSEHELSQIAGKLASEQVPTPQVESSTDDVLVDVDFHSNLSFRELQLHSIDKLHRQPVEPIARPKPPTSKYRVLRTHYNPTGYYYGMRVKRLLVKDLASGEEFWTGSNDLDNIQVGDIVIDSTGVGFVVPINRTAKV